MRPPWAGTPSHVSEKDAFSATRKCHDANGEISYVFFGRKQVRAGSLFANEKRFFSG